MGTRCAGADGRRWSRMRANFWPGWRRKAWPDAESIFRGWAAGRATRIWRRRRFGAHGSELWHEDLAPYRELRDEMPMVMVNHAAYPETPGRSGRPASRPSGSRRCCASGSAIAGIVFSDDLEMGGILKFMPIEEAAVARCARGWT